MCGAVAVLATVGWPEAVIALVVGLPAIIGAVNTFRIRKEVHPANGHTLAATVEHMHEKAVETNAVVTRTLGGRDANHVEDAEPRTARERNGDD